MQKDNAYQFSYTLSLKDQINSYEGSFSYRATTWPIRLIGVLLGTLAIFAGLESWGAMNGVALVVIGAVTNTYLLLFPIFARLKILLTGKPKTVNIAVGITGIKVEQCNQIVMAPWLMYLGGKSNKAGVILCFRPQIDIWIPNEVFGNLRDRENFLQYVAHCVRELNRVFDMVAEMKPGMKWMQFISRLLGR